MPMVPTTTRRSEQRTTVTALEEEFCPVAIIFRKRSCALVLHGAASVPQMD